MVIAFSILFTSPESLSSISCNSVNVDHLIALFQCLIFLGVIHGEDLMALIRPSLSLEKREADDPTDIQEEKPDLNQVINSLISSIN